jgi:VanZ family protein
MKKLNSLPLGSWLQLFAFVVIIYFVSAIDGNALPELNKFCLDKVAHFIEYGILTLLVIRAVKGSFPRLGLLGAAMFAAVLVLAFAFMDERHQIMTPNRTCSFADFIADFIGSSAAILASVYKEDDRVDSRNIAY